MFPYLTALHIPRDQWEAGTRSHITAPGSGLPSTLIHSLTLSASSVVTLVCHPRHKDTSVQCVLEVPETHNQDIFCNLCESGFLSAWHALCALRLQTSV